MTSVQREDHVEDGRQETSRETAQRRLRSLKTGVVAASAASLIGFLGVAVAHDDGGGTASGGQATAPPQADGDGGTRPTDDTVAPDQGVVPGRGYVPGGSWDTDGTAPDWQGVPSDPGGTAQPDPGFFGGDGAQGPVDGSGAS
jgi:hypothetical protein